MAERAQSVETVVVGAGQAGLVMSSYLRQAGREHLLLDRRGSLGGGWQDRWDAFQLVSPNWTVSMPGFDYRGADPDGFMARDDIVDHFRAYANAISAPVQLDTDVTRLVALDDAAARFRLTTSRGTIDARNVVVAGGPFQVPFMPATASLDPSILQLHSHHYRNPGQLPPGGVLLVGSGQSGVQLAEEVAGAGRRVTLSIGKCGRVPRRYRDRDMFWWLRQLATRGAKMGVGLPTADKLPDPRARFACNPHLSGHDGGHTVNLRRMAAEGGIRLVGRFSGVDGTRATFAADLGASLAFADRFFDDRFKNLFETFIERTGQSLPDAQVEQFDHEPPEVTQLDLAAEGISTILWTSGYRPAFGWIELPVLDEFGLPQQTRGVTSVPGLTFIGTPWMYDMGSANLVGVARDAEYLARLWERVAA